MGIIYLTGISEVAGFPLRYLIEAETTDAGNPTGRATVIAHSAETTGGILPEAAIVAIAIADYWRKAADEIVDSVPELTRRRSRYAGQNRFIDADAAHQNYKLLAMDCPWEKEDDK